jgi:ParB family chromosome partitioning protein
MKRRVLGRGLAALLPRPEAASFFLQIELDRIRPNPFQPRIRMDSARLQELADSITENGVLQPIVVRSRPEGYEIVAGERRWKAAQQAGLARIPAVVQDLSDEKMVEVAVVENIQRDELSPIEEAHAYHILIQDFRLTQEQVSQRVGRSRAAVANTLRLLRLPKAVQESLLDGKISMGHARALIPLTQAQQLKLARQIVSADLSVRQVERRVQALRRDPPSPPASLDPNVKAAQQRLERRWKTRVKIRTRGSTGQIVFHFNSSEELDRLYENLMKEE